MDRQSRAKRIADLHVFYGQNEVVEELIRAGKIDEEYTYPFVDTNGEVFCPAASGSVWPSAVPWFGIPRCF